MRQKKSSMEKIMREILEKVIMLDRYMSNRQMYSFLKLFFNTKKIKLK